MSRAQLTSTVEQNTGGAVAPFVAGKNKVINGDFGVWQRGTTGSGINVYTADRWFISSTTSQTVAQYTTSLPTGFAYAANWSYSGSYPLFAQYIELPATGVAGPFTGTWTMSYWAKASANLSTFSVSGNFNDGSSRSNAISGFNLTSVGVTTSWVRYTQTVTFANVPNGTNKSLELAFYNNATSGSGNIYITGVQLEAGSVATPFTTASGTLQGELALCQRYYFREGYVGTGYEPFAAGLCFSSTQALIASRLPFQMRVTPAVAYSSTVGNFSVRTASNSIISLTAIAQDSASPWNVFHKITVASGLVAGNATLMNVGASGPCYIEYNSEL